MTEPSGHHMHGDATLDSDLPRQHLSSTATPGTGRSEQAGLDLSHHPVKERARGAGYPRAANR